MLRLLPSTPERATRLGLVTRDQMVAALVAAVESTPTGMHVVDVPAIRGGRRREPAGGLLS